MVHLIRQIISRINPIKSGLILIICFYFKVCQWVGSQNFSDPLPALITSLPANIFPNKLTPSVPSNIPRKLPFCSLTSFFTISVIPSNNIPFFSRDLITSKRSFKSSLEIISVV